MRLRSFVYIVSESSSLVVVTWGVVWRGDWLQSKLGSVAEDVRLLRYLG